MNIRALVRRAFPYLVIAVGGFALAYVVVFLFVLPSKIIPARTSGVADDSAGSVTPPSTPETTPGTTFVSPPLMPAPLPPPASIGVTVPDLTGMALSDATQILDDLQFHVTTQYDTSSFQPENTVLRQIPEWGTQIAPGSTVALIVSRFPPQGDRGNGPGGDGTGGPAHDRTADDTSF